MLSSTQFRIRANPPVGERATVAGGEGRDPDSLLDDGWAIGGAFQDFANAESDHAMKGVYREMAAVFRRASTEAARVWRDANG